MRRFKKIFGSMRRFKEVFDDLIAITAVFIVLHAVLGLVWLKVYQPQYIVSFLWKGCPSDGDRSPFCVGASTHSDFASLNYHWQLYDISITVFSFVLNLVFPYFLEVVLVSALLIATICGKAFYIVIPWVIAVTLFSSWVVASAKRRTAATATAPSVKKVK